MACTSKTARPSSPAICPAICQLEGEAQNARAQRLVVPGQHRAGEVVKAPRACLVTIPLPVLLRVVAPVPDHRRAATPRATHPLRPAVLAHEGEALGVVYQARDVDQVRCGHDGEISSREAGRRALIIRSGIRPPRHPGPKATTPEPNKSLNCLRLAVGQNIDGAAALQIDDERAVALSSAPSPVVDADDARRRRRRQRRRPDQAQQRVAADQHGQPRRQAGASLTSCAEGDAALCLGKAGCAPHPRQGHCWQALGKDAARALGGRAPEVPDLQVELADTALPRQVAEAADVSAVDTARRTAAKGT